MMQPGPAPKNTSPSCAPPPPPSTPPPPAHRRNRFHETEDIARDSWQTSSPPRRCLEEENGTDGKIVQKLMPECDDLEEREDKPSKRESSAKSKKKKKVKMDDNEGSGNMPVNQRKKTTTSSQKGVATESSMNKGFNDNIECDTAGLPRLMISEDLSSPPTSRKKTRKRKSINNKTVSRKSNEVMNNEERKNDENRSDFRLYMDDNGAANVPTESMAAEKPSTKKEKMDSSRKKVAKVESGVLVAPVEDILEGAAATEKDEAGNHESLYNATSTTATAIRDVVSDSPEKSKKERKLKKSKMDTASSTTTTKACPKGKGKITHRQARMMQPNDSMSEDDDDNDNSTCPGAIHIGDTAAHNGIEGNETILSRSAIEDPTTSVVSDEHLVLQANLVEEESIIHATEVEGVEAAKEKKRIQKRRQFFGCSCLCLSSIGIVLGLVLNLHPDLDITVAPTMTIAPSDATTMSVAPSSIPSVSPSFSRFDFLVQTIGPDIIHDLSILQNTSSDQYGALAWLAAYDNFDMISDLWETGSEITHRKLIERYTMFFLISRYITQSPISFEIFAKLDTCDWSTLRWSTDILFIYCLNDGLFIDKMTLSGVGLRGTIPTEVALLTGLQSVDVSENLFTGLIPTEVGLLTNLVTFDLSSNLLEGNVPTELRSLSLLSELFLDDNNLVGDLDVVFCDGEAPLDTFLADCAGEANAEVTCTCCTACCDQSGSCTN